MVSNLYILALSRKIFTEDMQAGYPMLIIVLVNFGHSKLGQSCSSVEQGCTVRFANLEPSTQRSGAVASYAPTLPTFDTSSEFAMEHIRSSKEAGALQRA